MISLDAPHALWLLLLLPLFLIGFIALWRYRRQWSLQFNPQIAHLRPLGLTLGQWVALSLAWTAAVLAMTQPKGNARYPEELVKPKSLYAEGKVRRSAQEIILFVDTSASMSVKDSRTGNSRLDAAKDIADLIAAGVKGDELALYAFTYDVMTLSPPTLDNLYVRLMVRDLHINEGDTAGTSLLHALQEFQKRYLKNPSVKNLTLVILSDGGDNQIETAEGEAKQKLEQELLNSLQGNNASRLHVYTIGIGSQQGGTVPNLQYQGKSVSSRLEPTLLRMLASQGKGAYFAEESQASVEIVKDLFAQIEESQSKEEHSKITQLPIPIGSMLTYDLYYQLPLALAILLLTWALFAPETWRKLMLIPLIAIPWMGEAAVFDDAAKELEVGRTERAIALYESLLADKLPDWQRAIITYNMGTAYLLANQPVKAIQSYETIIWKKDPFPLLQRRLRTNRAIAYYYLALQEPREYVESEQQALEYLLEANDLIDPAIAADCAVQTIKGAPSCVPPDDLLQLQKSIQSLRSDILKQYRQQRTEDLKVITGSRDKEIERLLHLYRFAIVSDPPDQTTLENIAEGQNHLIAQATSDEKVALESAQEALQLAQKQNNSFAIRFELERGRFALSQLLAPVDHTTLSLLDRAIAAEVHALTLNRLLMRMKSKPQELKDEVIQTQQSILKMAAEFLPRSYKEQVTQFNDSSLSAGMRCQVQPWGMVYPLFIEGLQNAEKTLQGNTIVLANQTAAVVAWRKALRILQQPKKAAEGCPGAGASAPKEAIQNIIEMERDDRLPPTTPAIQVEGVMPW